MSSTGETWRRLGADTQELAVLVNRLLSETLSDADCDVKRAKDLTGMLKDLTQLSRELSGQEPRELIVSFVGEAEEWAD